jgi:azurin
MEFSLSLVNDDTQNHFCIVIPYAPCPYTNACAPALKPCHKMKFAEVCKKVTVSCNTISGEKNALNKLIFAERLKRTVGNDVLLGTTHEEHNAFKNSHYRASNLPKPTNTKHVNYTKVSSGSPNSISVCWITDEHECW